MVHILILEDVRPSREALQRILEDISVDILVSSAATLAEAQILLTMNQTYDMFLLDINLDMNQNENQGGIQFAKEVRQQKEYAFTPILMITSIASLELIAYREIHCYQYIMKPFDKNEITRIIKKILAYPLPQEMHHLIIRKNGINYKMNCNEIVYIQSVLRGVSIYLKEEKLEVPYTSLKQIMGKLPPNEFVQCHRMYIVNKSYVEYFDLVNCCIKLRGFQDTIDIGVTFKPTIGREFHE
ncbi:MAG: LytTR family DNA-binding domain-containing protein [Lachnospiraceae bacterium]